ncbi:MAG: sugar transferase [Bacteroidales bacterium]|jgi:lipopolysaccharide/colanic/teichoic acid biosynthesis glycosyltransferase|nr:sugar transferase [Bacteroidales bacterium]
MYRKFFKRLFDIVFSFLAIVVLSPLLVPVIIILLLTGEHYVFYGQKRVGHRNRQFKIWKFATMLKASPSMGTGSLTVKNDPRVFPFGRFLRKTKINELPQLFNILLGNMSIVGPRPQMEVDFLKFPDHVQAVIYNAVPGMTGIGSIIFRDEEKWISAHKGDKHEYYRTHIAPYKGELELWYHQHITFRTDFMLVFLTAWVIFFPKSGLVNKIFKSLPARPDYLD